MVAQQKRTHLPMQETWVQSLGGENPLEKEMAAHSRILAWEIPWSEEPGRLLFMGLQRAGHDLTTKQQQQHTLLYTSNIWKYIAIITKVVHLLEAGLLVK